jgi:hypothetical protein
MRAVQRNYLLKNDAPGTSRPKLLHCSSVLPSPLARRCFAPLSSCEMRARRANRSLTSPRQKGQSLRRRAGSITPIGSSSNFHRLTAARSQMRPGQSTPLGAPCGKKVLQQPPSAKKETFPLARCWAIHSRPKFLRGRHALSPGVGQE